MRKLARTTLLLIAFIAVAVGFVWFVTREPTYHGKRLRVWIREFNDGTNSADAMAAVHAYGTNAIPFYLKLLRRGPGLRGTLIAILEKHNLPRFGLSRESLTAAEIGWIGLTILGPDACPAIPNLVKLTLAGDSGPFAGYALTATGVDGAKSVTNLLRNPNPEIRKFAIFLAQESVHPLDYWVNQNTGIPFTTKIHSDVEPSARILIPALIALTADEDGETRRRAIEALGEFAREPESIVPPVLARIAQNPNDSCRITAIDALRYYGSNASCATVGLIMDLDDPNRKISRAAGFALTRIEDTIQPVVISKYCEWMQDVTAEINDRRAAACELAYCGAKARAAVPTILAVIHGAQGWLRADACWSLIAIDIDAVADIGPELMDFIKDGRINLTESKIAAIRALGDHGSPAKGSIPILLWALQNGDAEMRREAGIALKKIAPEEAAKAGVE